MIRFSLISKQGNCQGHGGTASPDCPCSTPCSSPQPCPGPGQWIREKKALVPIPMNSLIKAIKWVTNSKDLSERICGNLLKFFSKVMNHLHRWAAVGGVGCCLMSYTDSWDREVHSGHTAVWKFFGKVCSKIFYKWYHCQNRQGPLCSMTAQYFYKWPRGWDKEYVCGHGRRHEDERIMKADIVWNHKSNKKLKKETGNDHSSGKSPQWRKFKQRGVAWSKKCSIKLGQQLLNKIKVATGKIDRRCMEHCRRTSIPIVHQ